MSIPDIERKEPRADGRPDDHFIFVTLLHKAGYILKFEINLEFVFDLLPEVNISQLAELGKLYPELLRQYVSGSKKASEAQAKRLMQAIDKLANKLNSISLTA